MLLVGNPIISEALAKDKVKIATSEWAPFIGKTSTNNGYTSELLTAAFNITGYEVDIEFVTIARSRKLLQQGLIDGYITPYGHIKKATQYVLSDPFYGDSIGLLTTKSLDVTLRGEIPRELGNYIAQLDSYKFGILRGGIVTQHFESLPAHQIKYAVNDLQNIDYLAQSKVDFIVIGKYSAAELITNKRPHLIGQFEFLQINESNSGFRIAFSKKNKNHSKIRSIFNKGLKEIELNGTLAKLNRKHGIYPPKRTNNKTNITIGTVNNRDMLILEELSSIFEQANPDISIEWRIYDENMLRSRTLSDLAISDGKFDIMTIGFQEIPTWSKNNWLTPLKKLPKDYEVSDIFQRLIDGHSYNGELYALPFYAESSVTYFRKDLFSKANISMPDQPTYDEILKFAKAIHKPSDGVYGMCIRGKSGWGESLALISTMVNTYGGKWFDKNWQPQFNSKPWQQALTTYISLLTNYGPPKPWLNGYNESLALFLSGKCAIWIDATIASNSVFNSESSRVVDLVGITKAPIAKTPKGANWLWAWSFAIPTSSKNKEIAQKFITWATSKSYIELVAETKGVNSIPQGTRHSTYANQIYRKSLPYANVMFEAMLDASEKGYRDNGKPYQGIQFVEISEFPAIGNYVSLLIVEVLKGNMTSEVALKKAQNHARLQMSLSGYYVN